MKRVGVLLSYILSTIFLMGNVSEACEYVDVCSSCTYTTIQDAVNYVESQCSGNDYNYVIRVAQGIYYENNIQITNCRNITIEGGWNFGDLQNPEDDTHISDAALTLVDGCLDNGACIDQLSRKRVFYTSPQMSDLTLTIKDLTIQNGYTKGFGGGIFAVTDNNNYYNLFLVLLNNEIKDNMVEGKDQSSPLPHGPDGGGIGVDAIYGKIEATLKNNKIHHNTAEIDSGGILFRMCGNDITLKMQDNEIYENKAWFGAGIVLYATRKCGVTFGGGFFGKKFVADLSDNTISSNYLIPGESVTPCLGEEYPVADGGGLLIIGKGGYHTSEITLNNNRIENNQAALGAGIAVRVHSKNGQEKDTRVRLISSNNLIADNIIPDGSKPDGLDCTDPDLINPPGSPPDAYLVTGGGVTIVTDNDLTTQSLFTFDNDTISGNNLYDLAIETDKRDTAFISVNNSSTGIMSKYSGRVYIPGSFNGTETATLEGDLITDIDSDDFDDGDDNGWTQKSGAWVVENGEYIETDPIDDTAFSLVNFETQDMVIEVKGKDIGDMAAKNFYAVFAYNEEIGKAYWAGAAAGADKWIVEEIGIDSGFEILASQPETIYENVWYDLRVKVSGDTVILYTKQETDMDYEEKVSFTFDDTTGFPDGIPIGKIGLGGCENHAYFDNFSVVPTLPVAYTSAPLAGCPVRISGAPTCYSTIQEAYDAANDSDTIQCQAVRFMEDFFIDSNKSVTLEGGYSCDYTSTIDNTSLNGDISISDGTLTIGNAKLIIE